MLEIDSLLLRELAAETKQESILLVLRVRFGELPPEIPTRLGMILKPKRLRELIAHAATCPDLEAFRARLHS
jgi:hypothetical protein